MARDINANQSFMGFATNSPQVTSHFPRLRHPKNMVNVSLVDVDLTHPFLLANDFDSIA
jgi:hypothetical protein